MGKYHRKALYFSLQPFFGEIKKMVSKAVACSLSWNIIRTFKKYEKVHPKKKDVWEGQKDVIHGA